MNCRCILVLCVVLFSGVNAQSGEVVTVETVKKMLENQVPFPNIREFLTQQDSLYQFNGTSDEQIVLTKAAGAAYDRKDLTELLSIVQKKAKGAETELKNKVDRFVNIAKNRRESGEEEYKVALRALMRDGKAIVPYLLKHMDDEDEFQRDAVLDALGKIGDKSDVVVKNARLMLQDRHPAVRVAAAKAVAALGGPLTAAELLDELTHSRDQAIDGIAMALGYLGDKRAVGPLTFILLNSQDKDGRLAAAFALGELRTQDKESVKALLEAIIDNNDERLRRASALALSKIGNLEAVPYIMRAYDRYKSTESEMLDVMKYFKCREAILFLLSHAEDDKPANRSAAIAALKEMTGENMKSGEEWKVWWNYNQDRPEFASLEAANKNK